MKSTIEKFVVPIAGFLFVLLTIAATTLLLDRSAYLRIASLLDLQPSSVAAAVTLPFHYEFRIDGTLQEAGKMDATSSPYWWLNSGGLFYLREGTGNSIFGELPASNKWRLAYALSNPLDTDNGYHPQNILRLVFRSQWLNIRQENYFIIRKDNMSSSPNRNESNGLLLMSRYQDGQSLYYAGLRVDGTVVIKKKLNGIYTTLAQKAFIPGLPYNRNTNPDLIPKNIWIGLRNDVVTLPNGSVSIKLYVDMGKTGVWTLALQTTESASNSPIISPGFTGLRTDFMDVQFDDYKISAL